jgi:hypothetical protein
MEKLLLRKNWQLTPPERLMKVVQWEVAIGLDQQRRLPVQGKTITDFSTCS